MKLPFTECYIFFYSIKGQGNTKILTSQISTQIVVI